MGLLKGQTILPLPTEEPPSTVGQAPGKEALYALEDCIVTWTEQIKMVLLTDPDDTLKEDETAGCMKQIEFWENKLGNLEHIQANRLGPWSHLLGVFVLHVS